MRAAVLYEVNRPLVVRNDLEIPQLLPGQVLVKIEFSGICRSQLYEISGNRGPDRYLPHLLGHEGCGIVFEVGVGVKKFKIGDRVGLGWIKGSGMDVPSTRYKCGDEWINAGAVTTLSDFSVVSENRCFHLPSYIPAIGGSLFGCAIPTGAGIIINTLNPPPGSDIAIFGLGGIGMSSLIACKLYSFRNIYTIDLDNEKLALAKSLGATETINSSNFNVKEELLRLTNGLGVDFSVEATGVAKIIELAFSLTKKNGGLCVFASHPPAGERISLDPFDFISGKKIVGSWGGGCNPDTDFPKFFELYKKGFLPIEKLIGKTYLLEDINCAIDDFKAGRVLRPLIAMN